MRQWDRCNDRSNKFEWFQGAGDFIHFKLTEIWSTKAESHKTFDLHWPNGKDWVQCFWTVAGEEEWVELDLGRKLDSANEETAVSDPTSPQKVINFQCNIVLHVCLLLKYKPNKKMRWSAPCYCTPPLVSLGWDNLWALVVPPLKRLSFFHSTDSLSDPLPNN